VPAIVLNEGPIVHVDIERYDDPGLDVTLEADGISIATAAYRLLLIEVASILETRLFAQHRWAARRDIVNALTQGKSVPPIVVYRATDNPGVFGLIDGANRTFAHWSLGIPTIRAYELIAR
jgi:hypothetical protein